VDELIVRLMRTVANEERLKILSLLFREGEMAPSQIADKLRILDSGLSAHLAKLATAGLMLRRRSGGWMYCSAGSPYADSTLSGKTATWLKKTLMGSEETKKNFGLHEVRNYPDDPLHAVVFDAATAFTDVRRLQILEHLALKGATGVNELSDILKMSLSAARRQTDKLVRRGFITQQGSGEAAPYSISKAFKTSAHAELWEIVRGSWHQK
jgi:DNA-binding transcriptional ArsR family regulator